MWVLFAFGSALFAGVTAILAKVGVRDTDSDTATAVRTVVVLLFSWLMAWLNGSVGGLAAVSGKTWLFLTLSGLATGASWLCYFRALQLGDVNKVTPVDKSSTVLTMLLAFIFLGEALTWLKGLGMVLIGTGAYLMVARKAAARSGEQKQKNPLWLLYALGSAVFASLTAILGKIGIENVDSTLGTAVRTCVVLVMAWAIVLGRGKRKTLAQIDRRSYMFLILSGFATGGSWLCYYRALQTGPASVVVPIDKLSILVSVLFARVAFHEKLTAKAALGLGMIVVGTLTLLV